MPERSGRYEELQESAGEYELPYISKSRVKSWHENPEHFRLKYLEGFKETETEAMDRGSRIHKSIEVFYENAIEQYEEVGLPPGDYTTYLPDDRSLWADFIDPYLSNFFAWEHRRLEHAPTVEAWLPVAIEEEYWLDDQDPPWTGLADAIYNADSIPEFDGEDGVVIVDFKTGKVPKQQYRDDGIYLELAYYEALFSEKYDDIAGSGAYYPKEDEFIVKDVGTSHDILVNEIIEDMEAAVADYDGGEHFQTKPGPLCKWGEGDDQESAFYGICPCTWGVPANNRERFEELVENGATNYEIAGELNTTTDAVGYWKYKFGLK